jgi:hypothetical protein
MDRVRDGRVAADPVAGGCCRRQRTYDGIQYLQLGSALGRNREETIRQPEGAQNHEYFLALALQYRPA